MRKGCFRASLHRQIFPLEGASDLRVVLLVAYLPVLLWLVGVELPASVAGMAFAISLVSIGLGALLGRRLGVSPWGTIWRAGMLAEAFFITHIGRSLSGKWWLGMGLAIVGLGVMVVTAALLWCLLPSRD